MEDIRRFGIVKLGDENYHVWRQRTELWLRKEDLWDTIEDTTPAAPDAKWMKRDRQARATIGLLIEDKFLTDIKHEKSAQSAWRKLQNIHSHNTLGSRLLLYRKIFSSRYTPGTSMVNHITDILEAASKLEDAGFKLIDELVCSALLGSLPREYDVLITTIEGKSVNEITIDYVREKILEESRKKEKGNTQEQIHTKALFTHSRAPNFKKKKAIKCYYCQKVGHVRKDCRLLKNHQAHGDINGRPRHDTQDQARIMGYPQEQQFRSQATDRQTPHQHDTTLYRALNTSTVPSQNEDDVWIIDTGAADHMCRDLKIMHSVVHLASPITVVTASGERHSVHHKGDCVLQLEDKQGTLQDLLLKQVLYLPALTENLVSIARLDKEGLNIRFNNQESWLITGNMEMRLGKLKNKLYVHDVRKQTDPEKAHICSHIWHERLGHRNTGDVIRMKNQEMTEDMKFTNCITSGICAPCTVSKMTDRPYPTNRGIKSTMPFQRLHSDLCGPIAPESLGHNSYILSIVDDYSKFTSTYMLRNKHQVTDSVVDFVEKGINKFGRRPQIFFSDGGGEYVNRPLDQYLSSRGIKHLKSLPYTPEENGTVERNNRTLMDTVRTLINQTKLPDYLWGELAGTATYLLNLVAHKAINRTPFELWHNKRPTVNHLRTIGTTCYFLNNHPNKLKLEDRGIQGVLIGYGASTSFYRIWNTSDHKIYESRKVIFTEEKCPLHKLETLITPPNHTATYQLDEQPTPQEPETPRRSLRKNIGIAPKILSYDQMGEGTRSYQDWFNNKEQSTNSNQSQ